MPVYEHTSGERQHTAPDSLTDVELGLKALDPASGWRCVDPPASAPTEPEPPHDPPAAPADDPDTPDPAPTTSPAARRRTTKET